MMRITRPRLLPLAALLLASACTVGPDYAPFSVAPATEAGAPFHRADASTQQQALPVARWWEALRDPLLTQTVDAALAASPTLAAAEARVRQARAMLTEQERELLPNGTAGASYLYGRLPASSAGLASAGSAAGAAGGAAAGAAGAAGATAATTPTKAHAIDGDLYNANFDATWEIDIFGRQRRAIEAARASAQAAEEELHNAQVSLAAEVAQAYVSLRDGQAQLAILARAVDIQQRAVSLTRQRVGGGTATELELERLRTQLEQTRAQVPPMQAQVEEAQDRLAVLAGREPGAFDSALSRPRALPLPPARLAVGDPAAMLRRRPDIRSAERQVAATTAEIGMNVADLFPTVNLLGFIGMGGPDIGDVRPDNYTAAIAPMLRWNFLDFGRIRARIRQSEAARDEALATYQQSVLQALQDANSGLTRFRTQKAAVSSLARAQAAAAHAADLTRQRYELGTASLIDWLDTERQRLDTEQQLAEGRASLVDGFISLQKSLGLGWGDAAPPPPRIEGPKG